MKKAFIIFIAVVTAVAVSACRAPKSSDITPKATSDGTKATPEPSEELFKPLEIKDFGYTVSNGTLYYGIIMHNPNESTAVEFPTFRMTARNQNGEVVGTDDEVLSIIYPQQDLAYGFRGFEVVEKPTKVEIEALEPDDGDIMPIGLLEHPEFKPLEVIGANKRDNHILGEVSNPNDYTIESAAVTVLFKDSSGKILSGDSTFIDKIPANGKTPFDLLLNTELDSKYYEMYAYIR